MAELSGLFGDSGYGSYGSTTTGIGGLVNPLWPVTITVWGGSSTVIGINSYWTPPYVNVGDSMTIEGFNFNYDIIGIISTTCLKITPAFRKTGNYIEVPGAPYTGTNFKIGKDYTLNRKLNEIEVGDRDWPYHYRQAERRIDSIFYTVTPADVNYLRLSSELSYNRFTGMCADLDTDDEFTFGSLGKWSQWETDGGTVTSIGGVSLACAITDSATSLASCMFVGEQPVCAGGKGTFLFTGNVRNQYWNFSKIGNVVYMSSDMGGITETMLTSDYFRQTVGTVLSKDTLYFKPDFCLNTTTVKGFS